MSDIVLNPGAAAPCEEGKRALPLAAGRTASVAGRLATWEGLGWLLMAALLAFGLPMAYQRAVDKGPDLAGFCDAGRYILEHHVRDPHSALSRYWPSADVPWVVFSLLPIAVAAVLWYCLNCATWFGLLHTIYRRLLSGNVGWASEPVHQSKADGLGGPSYAVARHATLVAGLLAMPLVLDGMAMGSFHILMVWLMIAGLDRAFRGQPVRGGLLLGAAAWLKLLPMLGVALLVYHRKWKAAVVAVAMLVVLEIGLSLMAFGPAGAWREHVRWWQHGAKGTTDRQLASAGAEDEDRLTNQSVAITARRLFTSLGTCEASAHARRRVQLAEISPQQLRLIYLAATGLLVLAVAVFCRPVSQAAWAEKGPAKIAMVVVATLWFSPVTWSYHYIAATPAVAILLLRARYRWTWVLPVLLVWCGGLCLLASDTCRVAGVLLWMSLLIGAGLALTSFNPEPAATADGAPSPLVPG